MFYQPQHSTNADTLQFEQGFDFSFPAHLHNSFELIVLTEGSMEVTVDRKKHTLSPGDACLVFPNQIHELHTPEQSRHFLCIFSSNHVHAYTKRITGRIPAENRFTPDPFYLKKLISLHGAPDILTVKGLLYSICAEFDRDMTYTERQADRNELLFQIFHFVETNFGAKCTLEQLSESTSYHYVYLSRYFKKCTGISFTEYVNRYRVNQACYLIKNSEQSILQTALDCGYDSLRSFNRNFKSTVGITPSEYREQIRRTL